MQLRKQCTLRSTEQCYNCLFNHITVVEEATESQGGHLINLK